MDKTITQSIGGSRGACRRTPPLQDPILSFSHTFSLKSAHVGGQNPPKWVHAPPTENPGSGPAKEDSVRTKYSSLSQECLLHVGRDFFLLDDVTRRSVKLRFPKKYSILPNITTKLLVFGVIGNHQGIIILELHTASVNYIKITINRVHVC